MEGIFILIRSLPSGGGHFEGLSEVEALWGDFAPSLILSGLLSTTLCQELALCEENKVNNVP